MQATARFALPAFLPACFLLLAGCGGVKRAPVSGKITIDGKEPGTPGVIITFVGPSGQGVPAEVGTDGAYSASGVEVGKNRVSVTFAGRQEPDLGGKSGTEDEAKALEKKLKGRDIRNPSKASPVPPRYADPVSSKLEFTVEAGDANKFSPDLKK